MSNSYSLTNNYQIQKNIQPIIIEDANNFFSPIHNTHIDIAEAAKNQFNLDIVYFLVSGTPPHKSTNESVADLCRLEMVHLAVDGIDGFLIDDREFYRAGKSYSQWGVVCCAGVRWHTNSGLGGSCQ